MSNKQRMPPVLEFGQIVYSDNFYDGVLNYPIVQDNPEIYGTKVGIIISSGMCGSNYTGTVAFYNSKGDYDEKTGNLSFLRNEFSIKLHVIGMKITDNRLKAARERYVTDPTTGVKRLKNLDEEEADRIMTIGFLYWLQVDEDDTVKTQVKILLEKLQNPTQETIIQEIQDSIIFKPPERINNYATIFGESLNKWLKEQSYRNKTDLCVVQGGRRRKKTRRRKSRRHKTRRKKTRNYKRY